MLWLTRARATIAPSWFTIAATRRCGPAATPDRAASTQPGRRPRPEPGATHHRHDPDAQLPDHPGLRRPAHRRRQEPQGDPALPQALYRPPALPHPRHRHDPGRDQLTSSLGNAPNPLDTNRSVHEPPVTGVSPRPTDRRQRQELRNTRALPGGADGPTVPPPTSSGHGSRSPG